MKQYSLYIHSPVKQYDVFWVVIWMTATHCSQGLRGWYQRLLFGTIFLRRDYNRPHPNPDPWPNPTLTLTLLKRNVRCKEWHDVIRRRQIQVLCFFTAFPAHACTGQYWRNRRKLFLEQLRIQHIIYWSCWGFLLRPTVNCGASRLAESDAVPRLVPVEPVVFLRGCFLLCYVASTSTEEKLCSF